MKSVNNIGFSKCQNENSGLEGKWRKMKVLGRVSVSCMTLASVLIFTTTLMAGTVISVTSSPDLSALIDNGSLAVSWSQSRAYSGVNIAVLVDSALVGETPIADAYLTTRLGSGTTIADEVAYTAFTVPQQLPVCSPASCGAWVTLFSGLSLGPGTYFLAVAPDPVSVGVVGWFPAENPTVVEDVGVSLLDGYYSTNLASYPPASDFVGASFSMNFGVTETAATPTPEPGSLVLVGTALVGLAGRLRTRLTRNIFRLSCTT